MMPTSPRLQNMNGYSTQIHWSITMAGLWSSRGMSFEQKLSKASLKKDILQTLRANGGDVVVYRIVKVSVCIEDTISII